jgi:hypothetical protein
VYLNPTKTQWIGSYSEYALDGHGVERRKRVRIVLSPSRKDDGTSVRKNEAKNLLQPDINRVNEQSTFPSRERKTATFEGFAKIWEDDYLILSKPSTQSSVRTQLRTLKAEFGTKEMRSIDTGDVQRLISRLTREGREPKSIRNMWRKISLIWQAALAQKFVDSTLPKPKLPKTVKKRPRFFRLSDVSRIIASTKGTQRCLYWLLAETDIRAGELAGLRSRTLRWTASPLNSLCGAEKSRHQRLRIPSGRSPYRHSLPNCFGGRLACRRLWDMPSCSRRVLAALWTSVWSGADVLHPF